MTGRTVRIELDTHPAMLMSANRRVHWSKRAALQRAWRERVHWLLVTEDLCEPIDRATVTAIVRYPDNRRRDLDNLTPLVVKPCIDGAVDAGLLPGDDDRHVVSVTIRADPQRGPHRVTLIVEDAT